MHDAVTIALTDWLAGTSAPGKGVNDYLPSVPRFAIDAAAPAAVEFIADEFRDDRVAAFETPPKERSIYVMADGPVTKSGEVATTMRIGKSVGVVARVIVKSSKKAATRRWASYVGRAIEWSIAAFLLDNATAQAGRERIDVLVTSANAVSSGPWYEEVGEATAIHVVAADLMARDTRPWGPGSP